MTIFVKVTVSKLITASVGIDPVTIRLRCELVNRSTIRIRFSEGNESGYESKPYLHEPTAPGMENLKMKGVC